MRFTKKPLAIVVVIIYSFALCFSIAYRISELRQFVTVEEIQLITFQIPVLLVIVISALFFLSRPFIMNRETENGITKWNVKNEKGIAIRIFNALGSLAIVLVSVAVGYLFFFVPFNVL